MNQVMSTLDAIDTRYSGRVVPLARLEKSTAIQANVEPKSRQFRTYRVFS
jgi:hypothetical protein